MIIKPTIYQNPAFKILTASEKSILLNLMVRANEKTKTCYPSIDLITQDTGLVRSTVCKGKNRLTTLGWIEVVIKGKSKGNANKYRVNDSPLVRQEDQLDPLTSPPGRLVTSPNYAPLTDNKEKENLENNIEYENQENEVPSSLTQGESPIETEHSQQVDPSIAYGEKFDKAKIEKPDLKDKYQFISLFLKWIVKNFDLVFGEIISRNPEWQQGTIVKGIQSTEKKLKLLVEKDSSKDLFPGFEENTVKETLFDFLSGKDPQNEIVDFLKEKHLYIFLLGSIFNETRLKKSCKAVA